MAENTVLKEPLTNGMIDAGAHLVRKLDEMGVEVTSALWLLDTEINEWRLLLASPVVSQQGPRTMYGKVQLARDELDESDSAVLFSAVSVAPENADLITRLRATVHTGSAIERIRFSKNVADGHFIEDALIYRSLRR